MSNTALVATPHAPELAELETDAVVERWVVMYPSEHTRRAYRSDMRVLADFLAGPPWSATVGQAGGFIEAQRGLAPATVQRRVASARKFYAWLKSLGAIGFNPFELAPRERTPDTLAERLLTQAEVTRLFRAANATGRVLLYLLYHGTARRSEAAALRVHHLRNGVLTIHGKGQKTRAVAIPEDVNAFLGRWIGLWELGPNDGLLFTVQGGRRRAVAEDTVYQRFKRIAAEAGLPDASPHWMRHAHATHAIAAGAELTLVAATLGHGDVKTTARYVHVAPERSSAQFLPAMDL